MWFLCISYKLWFIAIKCINRTFVYTYTIQLLLQKMTLLWNMTETRNTRKYTISNCRKQLVNAVNWWRQKSFVCDEQIITTIITCFHVFICIITTQLLHFVEFQFTCELLFSLTWNEKQILKFVSLFSMQQIYGSQLQVQDRQISRIRKYIYILILFPIIKSTK